MFVLWDDEFMPAVGEIEATRASIGQNPVIARGNGRSATPENAPELTPALPSRRAGCLGPGQCFFNDHGVVN
jgi:hypothetical protein